VTQRFTERFLAAALLVLGLLAVGCEGGESAPEISQAEGPVMVVLKTNKGDITIELDTENAPLSSENFLQYVDDGHFDGTVFHRVIPGFMIQGGGFTPDMQQKPTRAAIKNEAGNGVKNMRGTLAMARTGVVDSATAQFFVNLIDNDFLNHTEPTDRGFGYAVFGRVSAGMDVVELIAGVETGSQGMHQDVPSEDVLIEQAARVE
jgi:peptidyl-prolyl cis-trans isomerase B (cyclophilin B)